MKTGDWASRFGGKAAAAAASGEAGNRAVCLAAAAERASTARTNAAVGRWGAIVLACYWRVRAATTGGDDGERRRRTIELKHGRQLQGQVSGASERGASVKRKKW